jgi:uncharacterized protein with PIN domain
MLKGLARWLRAAGYDTALAAAGGGDRGLLERACREERCLLTRDRKLLELRGARRWVRLLPGQDLESWAAWLRTHEGVDWGHRPFSRCLRCNVPVENAAAEDWDRVPASSRRPGDPLFRCPACGRLYWSGSHVRRMRARLARWQGAGAGR